MATQLIAGLEFMHQKRVIHRDMKPPNTLLDDEGNLRITDFGLSLKLKDKELLFDRTGTKPCARVTREPRASHAPPPRTQTQTHRHTHG
eukprot:5709761-Prymnesium_polylepis.1